MSAEQVRRTQQSLFGQFVQVTACSRCQGEGTIITNPCSLCKGAGREKIKRKLTVTIPAGVDENNRLRLRGEGNAGMHGGYQGDIYVTFLVKSHKYFERDGSDVFLELPLNFAQAALGGVQVAGYRLPVADAPRPCA